MTLLERLNNDDRFAKLVGAQLTEISEAYAKAELTVDFSAMGNAAEYRHLNGGGVCQGGVIFTLADLAFAAVANSHGTLTLGISNNITFLKPAQKGDRITAVCHATHEHHKLPYCNIRVTNQNGELICNMTGLAYRTKQELQDVSQM